MNAHEQTEGSHETQLWINNPTKERVSIPEIYNLQNDHIPSIIKKNYTLKIITGKLNNYKAKIQIAYLMMAKKGGIEITDLQKGNNAMLYIL